MESLDRVRSRIGGRKKQYLRAEYGAAVELMTAIKLALDPLRLRNLGKILGWPSYTRAIPP
ncbi:FAD-linked oxidase C-terminal domain-containing protein [Nocardia sp. NPDC051052]|uniref:FAD-linked oxidase C-terminal domain-containing protein n=1 Tax=Nocardia sp. NPDC051052 TaxID=3364322 RepID=UPI0037AEEEB9